MTTNRSARVPLVHQSFSPFSTHCVPSALGSACEARFAGSDPTSTSVSANAEIAPLASRGKYARFCSSVPNKASGCGNPMDWCAESSAASDPSLDVTIAIAFT